jgi:F-type H+-transporting ATPase subunit delta
MADQIDQNIQSTDLVYGRALADLADEAGVLAEVADQMGEIGELLRAEPQLVRLLATRTLSVEQRRRIIENLFQGRVHDLVFRFLQVANAKNRLDRMDTIVKAVAILVDQKRGIVRAQMFVAAALDTGRVEALADRIGKTFGGRVILDQQVDPTLIGGLKLRIGDRLIDGSVAAQLRGLRRKFVAAGRDRTRGRVESLISE